jgi:predicted phage terminase large subunit-like protein
MNPADIPDNIDLTHLAPVDRVVMEEYLRRKKLRGKANSFLDFALHVYPGFIVEEVHVLIAAHFEMLRDGEIDRLMIMIAPRTGKSLMTSELLPAWWEGLFPTDKMLHASYATTLVEKFGRKIRNSIMSPEYQEIFPKTQLSKDSKSAAQWATTLGGEYNAVGVGGGVAGKGGNLLLIDDPVSEQDMFSKVTHNGVYEWYGSGFYTRRQPERNAIVLVQTRWRVDDLAGRLQADAVTNLGADQWTVLKIPAIVDEETADLLNECSSDPHILIPHFYKAGDSFSPRRWSLEELNRTKNTITRKAWASLYLQSPTEEEGGILLRDWWKPWKEDKPLPECEYILQSYDTAFEEGEANDYSARISWGVFKRPSDGKMCAIMLERMKARMSFPVLLENALASYTEYKPDRIVVEKAASGIPLIQEMRKRGIPVTPVKPVGSKIARANAATILLEQGVIYYPDRKWARDVIDECAEFPNGPHDDVPDAVVHGLNFLRRMFLLDTPADEEDKEKLEEYDPATAQTHRSYARRQSRMSVNAR